MRLHLLISTFALGAGLMWLASDSSAVSASPYCTSDVERDGSLLYAQVASAKPIKKGPAPPVRSLLPKRTMGAKMYLPASKGMTGEYLQRAAVCHARSSTPPVFHGDPLRVEGPIDKIRVVPAGGSFVLSVTAKDSKTGREIWQRAEALMVDVDADRASKDKSSSDDRL